MVSGDKLDEAEVHYRSGVDFQEHGRLEEAIVAYDEAVGLNPQIAAAYSVYKQPGSFLCGSGRAPTPYPGPG